MSSHTISIKCEGCQETFVIEPYFYDANIYSHEDHNGRVYCTARVLAKAVCPNCGLINTQACENEIYKRDIIDLAIRRYKRG